MAPAVAGKRKPTQISPIKGVVVVEEIIMLEIILNPREAERLNIQKGRNQRDPRTLQDYKDFTNLHALLH